MKLARNRAAWRRFVSAIRHHHHQKMMDDKEEEEQEDAKSSPILAGISVCS